MNMRANTIVRKAGSAFIALTLACMSLAPGLAYAAPLASEKSETVNVTVDAAGTVGEVEVESLLKNESKSKQIEDFTEVTGIKAEDDQTFANSGEDIVWEAAGKDVSYKGATDKELPIRLHVVYTLDGREIAPNDLVGKSGEVTIRYTYENLATCFGVVRGREEELAMPFTCITALMLDGDRFTSVEVKNGEIIDDSDDIIIAGYAMPGLKASLGPLAENADVPEYFEVRAQAEGFALKPAMTIVTAGLLSDIDAGSMGLGEDNDASELGRAMSQLKSGSNDLASGLKALADGADELVSGAGQLSSGSQNLAYGLGQLAYGSDAKPGLGDLAEGADGLVQGIGAANEAISALADSKKGMPAAAKALNAVAAAYPDAKVAAALEAQVLASDLEDEAKAAIVALLESASSVQQVSEAVTQGADGVVELSGSFKKLAKESKNLPTGVASAVKAAKALYAGSLDVADGAGQLESATGELASAMRAAADGSADLAKGLDEFDREGLSKVIDTLDNDINGFKDRLNALSVAAGSYDTFTGKAPGTSSNVKFVYESPALEA